jgi:hypothetical protein
MALYRIQVTDEQQRRHVIDAECDGAQYTSGFWHYRDTFHRLPTVRIPIGLPVYRMANIRTKTRQLDHIRRHGLQPGWFRANEQNVSAQQQQHEFLTELSKEGRGTTITPVFTVLQQEGQTEEILITRNGVVVNGNRRLAAMRELYTDDARANAGLSHVNAMVLPAEAQEIDLQRIELRLQMRRETKLPYEWVDEALGVREMKNGGASNQEIAQLMQLRIDTEVDQIITKLNEAELYLAYLDRPLEYALVYDSQQMFINWERALREPLRNQPNAVREGARAIAHVLTQQSRNLGERVHNYREAFGRDAGEVLTRLGTVYAQELAAPEQPNAPDDIFGEVAEPPVPAERVLPLLTNPQGAEELAQHITDIHESIVDEREDQRRGQGALLAMQKARRALNNVDLGRADPATFADIRAIAQEILGRAQHIITDTDQRG